MFIFLTIPLILKAEAVKKQQEHENSKDNDKETLEEKLRLENVEAEVELTATLDKKFRDGGSCHWLADTGPVYDCLVWNDGTRLRLSRNLRN